MLLKLKNVCSLKEAEIGFDGITVIAGKNNTGKSTVSKSLFSIFSSLYGIVKERNEIIISRLKNILFKVNIDSLGEIKSYNLCNELCDLRVNGTILVNKNMIENVLKKGLANIRFNKEEYDNVICGILKLLNDKNVEFDKIIIDRYVRDEYKNKINSVFYNELESKVELIFHENNVQKSNRFIIKDNKTCSVEVEEDIVHKVHYFDSLNVDWNLDLHNYEFMRKEYDHKHLFDKSIRFSFEKYIGHFDMSNDKYFSHFEELGEAYIDNNDKSMYKIAGGSEIINAHQMAQGLKSILVFRQLLRTEDFFGKNIIENKDVVILDEPETNLHPEWQVKFAKTLCEIQKEKDLTIMVCSHSPYFVSAIKYYSKINSIDSKCKYYLTQRDASNININIVEPVTNDVDKIFKCLYDPIKEIVGGM